MKKKIFMALFIIGSLVFSFTTVFAENGAIENTADEVRKTVEGAENKIEDAARDISGASKDATNSMENTGENMKNETEKSDDVDALENSNNDKMNTATYNTLNTTTDGNSRYTTNRTDTFMGMTSTAWTWLVLAVAAVVIIALVWYYSTQITRDNYNNTHHE